MDYTAAAKDAEVVSHFEELLDEWCRQIEKYLETSLDKGATQVDAGPRSEASTPTEKLDFLQITLRKWNSA